VASPDGRLLVLHPDGAGAECTQANAAGFAGAGGPEVSEEPQAASAAALNSASAAARARTRCGRLDVAVAVAGSAIVVGIVVSAVVLGDPVVMVVVMVMSRECHPGSAYSESQRGDPRGDPPACPGQHQSHPFWLKLPRRNTSRASDGMWIELTARPGRRASHLGPAASGCRRPADPSFPYRGGRSPGLRGTGAEEGRAVDAPVEARPVLAVRELLLQAIEAAELAAQVVDRVDQRRLAGGRDDR
jgi:hypothetical protein